MAEQAARKQMWVPTFDHSGQLLHVVVCFAVVNHRGHREDQFGLDLRKPVEDALRDGGRENNKIKVQSEKTIKKIGIGEQK